MQALLREANYYQLPGLVKRVELELDQQQESRVVNSGVALSSSVPSSSNNVRLLRGASSSTLSTPAAQPLSSQQSGSISQQNQQQQMQLSTDATILAAQSLENLRRIDDSCRRIWSFCSRILVGQDGYLHVKRY